MSFHRGERVQLVEERRGLFPRLALVLPYVEGAKLVSWSNRVRRRGRSIHHGLWKRCLDDHDVRQELACPPVQVGKRGIERDSQPHVTERLETVGVALELGQRSGPVLQLFSSSVPNALHAGWPAGDGFDHGEGFLITGFAEIQLQWRAGVLGVRAGGFDSLRPVDMPEGDVLRRRRDGLRRRGPIVAERDGPFRTTRYGARDVRVRYDQVDGARAKTLREMSEDALNRGGVLLTRQRLVPRQR